MLVFESVTYESLQSGYVDIICYTHRYFAVEKIKPMNLWSKICLGNKEKGMTSWHDIMLLAEFSLCTPFSNATLERFFSHLKVVKRELRSRLSSETLNSDMRICMKGYQILNSKKTTQMIVLITGTTQGVSASTAKKEKNMRIRKQ